MALQARHGEVVASARAMTEDTMRQIYKFNTVPRLQAGHPTVQLAQ